MKITNSKQWTMDSAITIIIIIVVIIAIIKIIENI